MKLIDKRALIKTGFLGTLLFSTLNTSYSETRTASFLVNVEYEYASLPNEGKYYIIFYINTEQEDTLQLTVTLPGADPEHWLWPVDTKSYYWTSRPSRIIDGHKGTLEDYFPMYLREKVPNPLEVQRSFSSKEEWHDVFVFRNEKTTSPFYQKRRLLQASSNKTENSRLVEQIESNTFSFVAAVTGVVSLVLLTTAIPIATYIAYRLGKSSTQETSGADSETSRIDGPYRPEAQRRNPAGIFHFPNDDIQPGACQQTIPMVRLNRVSPSRVLEPDSSTREETSGAQYSDPLLHETHYLSGEDYDDEESSFSTPLHQERPWYENDESESPDQLYTDV